MTIESEIMRSTLREWLDDTYSEATIRLSKNVVGTLLNRIEAQAARIAEQQAVIDQRNGECDRLFNELAALREQKPVAYSYRYAGCETCDGFQDWRNELSSERPPEWMIETGKVTELQYLFKGPTPVAVSCEPIDINNDMAIAFCHAISDSAVSADDVEEVKTGLKAAFANVPAAPVAVPLELLAAMEEVIRISDREHEAWHRAKAAIEVLRLNRRSNSDELP